MYLKELNLISVFCGDTGADIFEKDGIWQAGVVGLHDDDREWSLQNGTNKIANICCDNCKIEIIEKENLIEIVAQHINEHKDGEALELARDMVNHYIESDGIVEIAVNPGTYYLYYHPKNLDADMTGFSERFYSLDFELDEAILTKFILSNRKLEITNKPNSPKI